MNWFKALNLASGGLDAYPGAMTQAGYNGLTPVTLPWDLEVRNMEDGNPFCIAMDALIGYRSSLLEMLIGFYFGERYSFKSIESCCFFLATASARCASAIDI